MQMVSEIGRSARTLWLELDTVRARERAYGQGARANYKV